MVSGEEPDDELGVELIEFSQELIDIELLPLGGCWLVDAQGWEDEVLGGVAGFGDGDGFVWIQVADG